MRETLIGALKPVRFFDADAFRFVGLRESHLNCDNGRIPGQWMRFAPHIGHIPGEIEGTAYGICLPITGADDGFDYMAGVAVSGPAVPPAGLSSLELPARRYAAFAHRSHISTLADTIGSIWTDWLPASGVQTATSPAFIECYGEAFDPLSGMGGIEVWVPVLE